MSAQKWLEAAERYRRAEEEREREKAAPQSSSERISMKPEMDRAARKLGLFMQSEDGRAAMTLLAASKKHIIFGEEHGVEHASVVFMDGDGLRESYEQRGRWTVPANERLPKKISPTPPLRAIEVAIYWKKRKPSEVVNWLRGELDGIAKAAERQTKAQREGRAHPRRLQK